ncbi:MAG: UvrD-helicase domain-containing protein [Paracoccaceae bacterium]
MSMQDDATPNESAPTRPRLSEMAMAARPAGPAHYLDDLNAAQRAAVEAVDGPVLMLAGAGTGKTKALTTRIAHLINTGRAFPSQILAVTFTNKAAREMKDRIGRLLGNTLEGTPWMGTFHSICVKLLRRHAELVGLKPNFTILDKDDQIRLIKRILEAERVDQKRWTDRWVAAHIDNYKNRAIRADAVNPDSGPFVERIVDAARDKTGHTRSVGMIYTQYQDRLRALNAVDFGDLLLHMVAIFQNHPDVLAQYQRQFRYILVDEYQDTNVAQYMWLRLLASGHRNICCVGDDDQSIYGWRGAEVGNILRFESDFPGATVIRLEQNYRSTPHILGAASGVIAGNQGRLGKELWTDASDGEKVRLIGHWDGEEEARWIGEEIEALQRGTRGLRGYSLDDMAILVRASHQMRAFEDRFLSIGLPYRVIGGPRFYERLEIRDAMAYFRVVVSPSDDLAFERIVNTPKRGLGEKGLQSIQVLARERGISLFDATRAALAEGALGGKARGAVTQLMAQFARWQMLAQTPPRQAVVVDDDVFERDADAPISHIELAEQILDESGYTAMWQADKNPDAAGRLENLKELVKALEQFENLQGFLEHVALIMDNESERDGAKVSIMTLHGAKGLEFPVVFLPGWEDGLFPSQRSMDESGVKGLEEERRLAYVGITRAEEICTISFAANRRVYGQWQSALPSRFIDELPPEHVDVLTPSGLYGHAASTSTIDSKAARADVYNSPGWKRLQQAQTARPVRPVVIDAQAVASFTKGARVFHQKFGYGTVMGIEADKLDIEFDHAGAKKVVAKFIVPAEQAGDVPF